MKRLGQISILNYRGREAFGESCNFFRAQLPLACGCGVAETDSDGDFVPDCVDGCSMDHGKIDGGICGCGVSEEDLNNNGIVDCIDSQFGTAPPAPIPRIIVDGREQASALAERLARSELFEIVRRNLEAGDVLISDLIVERKRGDDFVRSLLDGRLFRQLLIMKRLHRRRLLVLEGEIPRHTGLAPAGLQGAMLRITGSMQIPILYTREIEHTALSLERVALQIFCFTASSIRSSNGRSSDSFYQGYILAGIPGIGLKRARALLDHFGSLRAIFSATFDELEKVPGLGPFHARRIAELTRLSVKDSTLDKAIGESGARWNVGPFKGDCS